MSIRMFRTFWSTVLNITGRNSKNRISDLGVLTDLLCIAKQIQHVISAFFLIKSEKSETDVCCGLNNYICSQCSLTQIQYNHLFKKQPESKGVVGKYRLCSIYNIAVATAVRTYLYNIFF